VFIGAGYTGLSAAIQTSRGGRHTVVVDANFDEVIIAIFVSGESNTTLTKHMFAALRDFIDPTIAAISTIMMVISTVLLLASQYFGARQK